MTKNLVREFVRRRVPQILGLYLGASWAAIEFVGMLVDRYLLSPHLVDLGIVLLASLIPMVALLAYFHGAPGRDGWTRTERVLVPANLIVSGALLAVFFGGKELGAATQTVVLEDDEGNTVERVVAKPEFRKHVALYFFDNESGDSTLDWLQHGIVIALDMDLSQDPFLATEPEGWEPGNPLVEAGYPDAVGVPLSLKRQLAGDHKREYFIDGSFVSDGDDYTIDARLYETARGKELATRSVEGSDLFDLIDQLSVQLREDLGVGEQQIAGSVDLPVSERLTASAPAFRLACRGWRAFWRNDILSSQRFLAKAVEEDPSFAVAQAMLGFTYFSTNQREQAERAWQAALQHLYRLPESGSYGQLGLKSQLYFWMGEESKALQAAEYAAELYPDDMWAHEYLAYQYDFRRRWEDVIREQRVIYDLDPSRTGSLLEIGNAHLRLGQFEQAEADYRDYAELEPEDSEAYLQLGVLYRLMGDHDRARSSYERAVIMDPENNEPILQLARLALEAGDFDAALAARDQALAAARSAPDSTRLFGFDEHLYYVRGEFAELLEAYRARLAAKLRYEPPGLAKLDVIESEALLFAAQWGAERFALATLDSLLAEIPEQFSPSVARSYMQIYLDLEDTENASRELARLQSAGESSIWGPAEPLYGEARLREIRQGCESAAPIYEKLVRDFPVSSFLYRWRVDQGRCLWKLRRFDEAEETLNYLLKQVPAHPYAHYELALVLKEAGRSEEAIAHLKAALVVWARADREFRPAQRAREELAVLSSE